MEISVQRDVDGPIEFVDDALLVRNEIVSENEDERTVAVEYSFPGHPRIVHRSVHVHLKRISDEMKSVLGAIG